MAGTKTKIQFIRVFLWYRSVYFASVSSFFSTINKRKKNDMSFVVNKFVTCQKKPFQIKDSLEVITVSDGDNVIEFASNITEKLAIIFNNWFHFLLSLQNFLIEKTNLFVEYE